MQLTTPFKDAVKVVLSKISAKVSILSNNNIHVHLSKGNETKAEGNKVMLGLGGLDADTRQRIFETLPEQFDKKKTPLIEAPFGEEIEEYETAVQEKSSQETLKFFKGKIPPEDLSILIASIYLQRKFESGEKVRNLKDQIAFRYGKRGTDICNLYSAGYFDELLKPLYEELIVEKGIHKKEFLEIYNSLIEDFPSAIFVSSRTTQSDLDKDLKTKIKNAENFNIKKLNIHGIGEVNIKKIESTLTNSKEVLKRHHQSIEKSGNIIVVRINITP